MTLQIEVSGIALFIVRIEFGDADTNIQGKSMICGTDTEIQ